MNSNINSRKGRQLQKGDVQKSGVCTERARSALVQGREAEPEDHQIRLFLLRLMGKCFEAAVRGICGRGTVRPCRLTARLLPYDGGVTPSSDRQC